MNSFITSFICVYLLLLVLVEFWKFLKSFFYTYKNKHYFITGGSEGLGRFLARHIALKGGRVTISARHIDQLNKVKTEIEDLAQNLHIEGVEVNIVQCDVTNSDSVHNSVEESIKQFGQIDVFISCAGYAETGYMFGMGKESFYKMMNVNYFGCLNCLYEIVPKMMKQNQGEIYIVSSAAGLITYIGYGAYSPSKYALKGLSDGLRNELYRHHIRVGTIYPPNMKTPGFKNENKSKPEEGKFIEYYFESCYDPEYCSKCILHSIERGDNQIYCGALDNYCVGLLTSGMGPRNNLLLDILLFPIIAPIFLLGYYVFNNLLKLSRWKNYENQWYPKEKQL